MRENLIDGKTPNGLSMKAAYAVLKTAWTISRFAVDSQPAKYAENRSIVPETSRSQRSGIVNRADENAYVSWGKNAYSDCDQQFVTILEIVGNPYAFFLRCQREAAASDGGTNLLIWEILRLLRRQRRAGSTPVPSILLRSSRQGEPGQSLPRSGWSSADAE